MSVLKDEYLEVFASESEALLLAKKEIISLESIALKQDAAFVPGVEGDWDEPIPSTIQGALDQLAARVRILEP